MTEQDRRRQHVSLDLLYVALENLLLGLDEADRERPTLASLVTLARDLEASIIEYWQSVDAVTVGDDLGV